MKLFLSEVYDLLDKAGSDDERVNILIDNHSKLLETTLYHTFAPEVVFFTSAVPAYKPNPVPTDLGLITYEMAMAVLYMFIEGHPRVSRNLSWQRKETMLVQTLEELGHREAEVYMNMIMKRPGAKTLTRDIVKRAYPTLLPDQVD